MRTSVARVCAALPLWEKAPGKNYKHRHPPTEMFKQASSLMSSAYRAETSWAAPVPLLTTLAHQNEARRAAALTPARRPSALKTILRPLCPHFLRHWCPSLARRPSAPASSSLPGCPHVLRQQNCHRCPSLARRPSAATSSFPCCPHVLGQQNPHRCPSLARRTSSSRASAPWGPQHFLWQQHLGLPWPC